MVSSSLSPFPRTPFPLCCLLPALTRNGNSNFMVDYVGFERKCRFGTSHQSHRHSVFSTAIFPDFFQKSQMFAMFAVRSQTCAVANWTWTETVHSRANIANSAHDVQIEERNVLFLLLFIQLYLAPIFAKRCEDCARTCEH